MNLEWDETKSEKNRAERGFGFEIASHVFNGPVVEWCDIREDWGEVRLVAVGAVGRLILTVVYTERDAVRRIISVCMARKKEAALWRSLENP